MGITSSAWAGEEDILDNRPFHLKLLYHMLVLTVSSLVRGVVSPCGLSVTSGRCRHRDSCNSDLSRGAGRALADRRQLAPS